MKMRGLIICLFYLLSTVYVFGTGIDFFKGSWDEALKLAQEEDKIIFVDAYAVWCGPCKRMAKNVFTDQKVGDFYNSNFVNVKMDMERGEGPEFGKKYPVAAFPTLYFIDGDGEVVTQSRGALDVEAFLKLGETALSRVDKIDELAKAYNEGDRSPELVLKYVTALNRSGEPSLKVANEYLYEQEDLTTAENLKLILEAATISDSRIFKLLIEHRELIEKVTSSAAVEEKIFSACEATVERAIEIQSESLLEEAKDKMKKYLPGKAKSFALEEDMHYYMAIQDVEKYLDACKKYAKKEAKGDPDNLQGLSLTITKHFRSKEQAMEVAEAFAAEAAEKGRRFDYYLNYAKILSWNGKKAAAITAAKQSLALAKDEKNHVKLAISTFLEDLKNS